MCYIHKHSTSDKRRETKRVERDIKCIAGLVNMSSQTTSSQTTEATEATETTEVTEADQKTIKATRKIIIALNIAGFALLISSLALGWGMVFGVISSLMGILAAVLALVIKSEGYFIPGFILMLGILIASVGAETYGYVTHPSVESEIVAPEHMVAIDRKGITAEWINSGETLYIYFGNEDCDDAEFLQALENVMDEADAYSDLNISDDNHYRIPDYYTILYFDTKLMPADETDSLLTRLGLNADLIPCLVLVSNGTVVRSVSVADEASIKTFIFGDKPGFAPNDEAVFIATVNRFSPVFIAYYALLSSRHEDGHICCRRGFFFKKFANV